MRKGVWGLLCGVLCLALMALGLSWAKSDNEVKTGDATASIPVKSDQVKSAPAVQAKSSSEADKSAEAAIRAGLLSLNENLTVDTVTKAPVAGIFQVVMRSGEILYMSADGKYIFSGDLMRIEADGLANLTDSIRSKQVRKALAAVDPADMVVFPPEGKRKGLMYVFTDVDCGYCRKLHQEVPELNSKGVEVRYLAFPRGGPRAPAFGKMISAWCAKDRRAAMTTLKSGGSLTPSTCDNPVDEQLDLGRSLGVRGTPAIFLEDGRSVPGYQPAHALLKMMEI